LLESLRIQACVPSMARGSPSCLKTPNSLNESEGNVNVDNRGQGKVFLSASLRRNIIQTRD
jgi:hypothetical protein